MRCILLLNFLALAGCQTVREPVVAKSQTWEEFIRSRPDTFIASYSRSLDQDKARLSAEGLASEHAAVRALVDAYLPAGTYTLQATGATAAVQRRLRVDSLTNNLVNYGYRARHLADEAMARRVVKAAVSMVAAPGETDLAMIAPTVVVADLERIEDPADGSTSLVYRVVEPIKNAPAKGSLIRLALRGPTAASPFPPPPQPGEGEIRAPGRVALFLTPPRTIGGISASGVAFARITQPMRLDGDKLTPGYHSDLPEVKLTQVRAAVREQVCAKGYVPVGKRGVDVAC